MTYKRDIDYLLRRTKRVGDCLEWQGAVRSDGYPWLPRYDYEGYEYVTRYGHRQMMAFILGRALEGRAECALHTCDNRKCINPEHLYLGTYKDNRADCVRKGREWKGGNGGHQYSLESRIKMSNSAIARHARSR